MKCQSPDCRGEYHDLEITHSLTYRETRVLVDQVPAAVCQACGHVLLRTETITRIAGALGTASKPRPRIPLHRHP